MEPEETNNTFLDIVKKAMPDKLIANFVVLALDFVVMLLDHFVK